MEPKAEATEVGDAIAVPQITGEITSGTTNDNLAAFQDKLFNKKEPQAKKPENKAKEIFEKTQEATKKIVETKPKAIPEKKEEATDDFTGKIPDFDASQFLSDAEKTEPTPPVKEPEIEEPTHDFDKETNLKNLRKVAGNFKKERDEFKAKIETLERELNGRGDASTFQNQINELKARVTQLEPYELLFGLQNNPKFKQEYIDRPNTLVSEMKQIATDYAVNEEVIEDILSVTNRRELDELLEENFSKDSARSDIKGLKQRWDAIQKEKSEFEKKPRETLAKFQSDQIQAESELNVKRDTHLKQAMANGWNAALQAAKNLPKEQLIYELIEQPGKKEHNEKVVAPTLASAQAMMQTGLDYIEKMARTKSVPSPAFVQWFSQLCQQAAATQMVNHVRWGIYEKYQDLSNKVNKQNGYDRPAMSSGSRGAPTKVDDGKKKSGKERAAEIFESVVG